MASLYCSASKVHKIGQKGSCWLDKCIRSSGKTNSAETVIKKALTSPNHMATWFLLDDHLSNMTQSLYMPADQCCRLSPLTWLHAPGRSHSPHTDQLLYAHQVGHATESQVRGSWPMPSHAAATPPGTSRSLSDDGMQQATYSLPQRVAYNPRKCGDGRSLSKLTMGDSHLQSGRFVGHGITHKVRWCNKGQKRQEAAGESTIKYLETFVRILYLPVYR